MIRVLGAMLALIVGGCGGPSASSPEPRAVRERGLLCTDWVHPAEPRFACGESELPVGERSLDSLAEELLANRGLTEVRLIGLQSRSGPEGQLSTELALRRAATVARALVEGGIDPALIQIDKEVSGYQQKSGGRRKSDADSCTRPPPDYRRSRTVRVGFTLCCPPERAVTRRREHGIILQCPVAPRRHEIE